MLEIKNICKTTICPKNSLEECMHKLVLKGEMLCESKKEK
jgi:hypothetical protein